MVAEPEVLVASVESTSDRKVCPELALWMAWGGCSIGPSLAQAAPLAPNTPGPEARTFSGSGSHPA